MIFKQIDIFLRIENAVEYAYSLKKKSRHILNYIERNCLKPLKFESDGFIGIIIDLRYGFEDKFMYDVPVFLSETKCLVDVIPFDKIKYDSLKKDDEFREFFHDCLVKSITDIEKNYKIPGKEILNCYQDLKKNNFVNEWVHQKKSDKKKGVLIELVCLLTIDKFQLTLRVTKEAKEIFSKVILEKDPDEIAFEYELGDILIEDDKITVTKKRKDVLVKIPYKQILNNINLKVS